MNSIKNIYLPLLAQIAFLTVVSRAYYSDPSLSKYLPNLIGHFFRFIVFSFYSKSEIKCRRTKIRIFILAVLYELQSFFRCYAGTRISPIMTMISLQIKIPFTCILSIIFLKKKYTILQIIGLIIIFSTIFNACFKKVHTIYPSNPIYFISALLGNICSEIANVYFNSKIIESITDFCSYIYQFSYTAFCISCFTTSIEMYYQKVYIDNHFVSSTFYLMALGCGGITITFSYISLKIDPQKRLLVITLFSSLSTLIYQHRVLIWYYLKSLVFRHLERDFDGEIEINDIVALSFTVLGIAIYEHKNLYFLFKKNRVYK